MKNETLVRLVKSAVLLWVMVMALGVLADRFGLLSATHAAILAKYMLTPSMLVAGFIFGSSVLSQIVRVIQRKRAE